MYMTKYVQNAEPLNYSTCVVQQQQQSLMYKAFWPNSSSIAANATTLPEALIRLSTYQI